MTINELENFLQTKMADAFLKLEKDESFLQSNCDENIMKAIKTGYNEGYYNCLVEILNKINQKFNEYNSFDSKLNEALKGRN